MARRIIVAAGLIAAGTAASSAVAIAQQATPIGPRGAVSQTLSSGFYLWVDGQYNRVHLPTYRLGLHAVNNATLRDLGSAQTIEPHISGGGVRGAIGYAMPGTRTRFEFGGSYVGAKASNSGFSSISTFGVGGQFLSGNTSGGYICTPAVFFGTCNIAGVLSTNFSVWQFNGKVATDRKFGAVTVTPSAAVFGGNTRANQTLAQSFAYVDFTTGVATLTGRYAASTSLKWSDVGGRFGLDVSTPVSAALTIGIGGWAGVAGRKTSLSGSDSASDTAANFDGSGALSIGDSKAVFLANAEASFAYKFTPIATLRGFAGLNYDGSVPGIAVPSFTGSFAAPTSTTAAKIDYGRETTFYAGGGLTVSFAP